MLIRVENVLVPPLDQDTLTMSSSPEAISKAYTQLIMEETKIERAERAKVLESTTIPFFEKSEIIEKLMEDFYYRRIINSTYFM